MKPDDFIYLCEKYDCNVTPYLISELGKTAAERSAFLLKDEAVETKSQIDVIASCQAVKKFWWSVRLLKPISGLVRKIIYRKIVIVLVRILI